MTETSRMLVLASNNAGKIRELGDLLAPLGLTVKPQGELGVSEAEEPAITFLENALIKARHAARVTGLPALADDSGLSVDALHGAPGVRSARFAGDNATDADNNARLLKELEGLSGEERGATFHCVLVYLTHADSPTPLVCHGRWRGRILTEPRGTGGFGYDPLFFVPDRQCSAAELAPGEKSAISHRGRALRGLLQALEEGQ